MISFRRNFKSVILSVALLAFLPRLAIGQGFIPGGEMAPIISAGPGRPAPPADPPTCPESLLGQVNGSYYYATSNCQGLTGFGQSPVLIPLPQCSNGACGRSVSTPYSPESSGSISPEELNLWIEAIVAQKDDLEKDLLTRGQTDTRRARIVNLRNDANRTLQILKNAALADTVKFEANRQFNQKVGEFIKSTERVTLAGDTSMSFSIQDLPIHPVAMKSSSTPGVVQSVGPTSLSSADELSFDTSEVDEENKDVPLQNRIQAQVEKLSVLKVDAGNGRTVFFQCFRISPRKSSGQTLPSLYIGLQVQPTDSALPGRFSERGSWAHRITSNSGTPFLVNSIDNLNE